MLWLKKISAAATALCPELNYWLSFTLSNQTERRMVELCEDLFHSFLIQREVQSFRINLRKKKRELKHI